MVMDKCQGPRKFRHRVISYTRGDPEAVAKKVHMGGNALMASEKDYPSHVIAAQPEAYTLLNGMFTDDSPAMTIIRSGAQSGRIPRGDGLALFIYRIDPPLHQGQEEEYAGRRAIGVRPSGPPNEEWGECLTFCCPI